ncbi:hypothetical protein Avbf_13995, partial [Armadillidium vulgare]
DFYQKRRLQSWSLESTLHMMVLYENKSEEGLTTFHKTIYHKLKRRNWEKSNGVVVHSSSDVEIW